MKQARWFDSLAKATKITIVVCGVTLIGSSVLMLFLMFNPIQKEDQPTVVVEPVRHTEYTTTTSTTTTPVETMREVPHTLSTWSAGISGYSRSLDEFKETENPKYTTTDPRLRKKETTGDAATTKATGTYENDYSYDETTAGRDDDDTPVISNSHTDRPQTVTTVAPEPELTPPPLPVEVDVPDNAGGGDDGAAE